MAAEDSVHNTANPTASFLDMPLFLPRKKMAAEDSVRNMANPTASFLDLPDLVIECILRKLPPFELLIMSCVCKTLRRSCTSDHMWENHVDRKWGELVGPAAVKVRRRPEDELRGGKQTGLMTVPMRAVWPCSWLRTGDSMGYRGAEQRSCSLADDSVMYWYFALENGRLWFPAQVYNIENEHAGFMLSCYDAEICYDSHTDTFKARYPSRGRRTMALEIGVTWERLRPPPKEITSPPHDLHSSDCLNDLHPGDSIEVQWRTSNELPYGWWYGVIGHLESCDHGRSQNLCQCQHSDDVVLEFNQYSPDSRWRRKTIDRRHQREQGNRADGFYGGIRKLKGEEEISIWKKFWPDELLE